MYRSADHQLVKSVEWIPGDPATRINDFVLMSKGTSNGYVVTSDNGDVVINAGTHYQGPRYRERFEELLGRPLQVKAVVLTQAHPDCMGGWQAFADPGVDIIGHEMFYECRLDRTLLPDYFPRRSRRMVGDLQPQSQHATWLLDTVDPTLTTVLSKRHEFTVGGRRFQAISTPGGETLDSNVLWLPNEKVVFTGNMMGALFGAHPALYTPRGDRTRSARQFIASMDTVISLGPELLITGHDDPIAGLDNIRERLTRVRDAVQYVHDHTVAGMNAGKDLHQLMAEVVLPEHLTLAPGRGPIRWYVRAVWEEYSGWFRFESTTELYCVPPSAIWTELSEMVGGIDNLARRARAHVDAGEPEEAIHFTDMALSIDPFHKASREAQIAALEQLIERTGGEPHDEIRWLEAEIDLAKAALKG